MSIAALYAEIRRLEIQIDDYNNEIIDLEQYKSKLEPLLESLTTLKSSVDEYDITYGDHWRGDLEQEGEQYSESIKSGIDTSVTGTNALIDSIDAAIAEILRRIEECYKRIAECYAEIARLEAEAARAEAQAS